MNASSKYTKPFVSALLMLTILLIWPLNAFSSTPSDAELQNAVDKAYEAFKDVKEGANADYIPILAISFVVEHPEKSKQIRDKTIMLNSIRFGDTTAPPYQ